MLTESMEDYLEMMYRIVEEKGYVRAVDLAESLNLQASSITKMIQKLDEAGFINYEKYRNIALTELGKEYGAFLVWRDKTLKEFLQLLTSQANIDDQVEGMEHYITPKTMTLVVSLISFFKKNPDALLKLNRLQTKEFGPACTSLELLRAWEFHHGAE